MLPEEASLHANLGLLLENLGRFAEAERHLRRAVVLAPDSAPIHSNLAGLLARLGLLVEAEAAYRTALRLQPEFATAHSNLGVLLTDIGRMAEAEASFREALRWQPDYLQGRMNLGQLLLALGRFAEGWPLYEGRQQVYAEAGSGPAALPPDCPQWQGEPLAGKTIVVMPEQGLGDELQFCRYLPWLKAQGAARVTLVCRPSQQALLQTLAGPDVVLSLSEAKPCLSEHDYWTFLLSLPLHAGTRLETVPAAIPYLAAEPQRQARFAPSLAGAGLRVGLVWRGNPKHSNDAERSLPGLEVLAPLWAVSGVRFFSLQKSDAALPPLPAAQPLVDLAPLIGDFADTAALLSQLDLLISVDSSVAHLAGALGVPCWILLPGLEDRLALVARAERHAVVPAQPLVPAAAARRLGDPGSGNGGHAGCLARRAGLKNGDFERSTAGIAAPAFQSSSLRWSRYFSRISRRAIGSSSSSSFCLARFWIGRTSVIR